MYRPSRREEPSKSVNRSTLNTFFRAFFDSLKSGKKARRYLDVFNHNMAKILIEQILVKRGSFKSESSFFEQKSIRKELFIGKYCVTKKYVRSKKTDNEEVKT